jgi:hypothetical protein
MSTIAKKLEDLFHAAGSFDHRLGSGIAQHAMGGLAVGVMKRLEYRTIEGAIVEFEHLPEHDKAFIVEVSQWATRSLFQYITHHKENAEKRQSANLPSPDLFLSHAKELHTAAYAGLASRCRSHAYDGIFGRPGNDLGVVAKQAVLAALEEVRQRAHRAYGS